MGLFNYVIMNITHHLHHTITHTLNLHHSHSTSEFHGHSHSSFIDYALYLEETTNKKGNQEQGQQVQNYISYFSHLLSNGFLHFWLEPGDNIRYHVTGDIPFKVKLQPPSPPPEFLIT